MLSVNKGIISTPTQPPLKAIFDERYIAPGLPDSANIDFLDKIEDSAGKLIERFGKGVGEGASENLDDKKFNIDLNIEEFIVPIVSGIILYLILKG
jgi:hypothetical protein